MAVNNDKDFVVKSITIRNDQQKFLEKSKGFKLSKFVQWDLDEYMKMRKRFEEFEKEVLQ